MRWTDAKPTRRGWYWHKDKRTHDVLYVDALYRQVHVDGDICELDDFDGQWSDEKIAEPEDG